MNYINDDGYEIPKNNILIFGSSYNNDGYANEIIEPLVGKVKRDWFSENFYNCLPLMIGNQYGFGIKSMRTFTAEYIGGTNPIKFEYFENEHPYKQDIEEHFGNGIITISHRFLLRTPPGVNLMTIQPPNYFIHGLHCMSGVVESDNLRMGFTFNLKLTPNVKVSINKGDIIAAFIPIERYYVENYKLTNFADIYGKDIYDNESNELEKFGAERLNLSKNKGTGVLGRRYFYGKNMDNKKYKDHQKSKIK
jgi:hypothetical protein